MAKLVTEGLPDQVAASLAAHVPGALRQSVVTGGAGNAELTLTGIATADTIIGAQFHPKEGGAVVAVTLTIPKADKVKTATDTTDGQIVVTWADNSNG